jgi:hypothetical protein
LTPPRLPTHTLDEVTNDSELFDVPITVPPTSATEGANAGDQYP